MPDFPSLRSQRGQREFPRYSSKEQVIAPVQAGAALDTTGEQISQRAKLGDTLASLGEQWTKAYDTIQRTTSDANFKIAALDIVSRAQNDPDYNNFDSYQREIDALKTKTLGGFSNRASALDASAEYTYQAKVASIQLQNIFKKKAVDAGRTSVIRQVDLELANPTEASLSQVEQYLGIQVNPKTKQLEPVPGGAVAIGLFDMSEAYQQYQKANVELGINRVNRDLYSATKPEDVERVRAQLLEGFYERGGVTIDAERKRAFLSLADSTLNNVTKKIEAQEAENFTRNRVDTILGVVTGELDPRTINIAEISAFDPELGRALTNVKTFFQEYNPKLSPEEQRVSMTGVVPPSKFLAVRQYADSISQVFEQSDNTQLGEFMLRELNKRGDGQTSSVKLAALMRLAALKFAANNPQTPEDREASEQLAAIQSGVAYLQASNAYLAPAAIGELLTRLFLRERPQFVEVMTEAKNILHEQIVKRYRAVAKLPAIPNHIVDGESGIETLHTGENELDGESFSGSYADTDRGE